MSKFDEALAKLLADAAFARQVQTTPEEALKPYDLTAEEIVTLKTLSPQLLDALRRRTNAVTLAPSWWKPATFREAGAALLSIILVALLLYATGATFAQVAVKPFTYQIDTNVLVVDPFDRAKDLLNIFFPLFGAVVTFWLGVTVEGRRADRNEAEAEQAKEQKAAAQAETKVVRAAATEALDTAETAILGQMNRAGSAFESTREAIPMNPPALDSALTAIQSGRQKLSR